MKTDMTAAEHLQQCAACNHGRTPCQEYVKAWPVKPNSVCAECKRPENYVGHTRYAMDYHPFEPVAEPAEPSIREEILAALPIKPIALLKKLSARGFKDEEAKLKLLSMLAANPPEVIMQNDQTLVSAEPTAEGHSCGTFPDYKPCKDCAQPYMLYGKTLMEIKMLIQQDDIRKSGTPKLEEIAREIAGAIVDTISDDMRWPRSSASTNRRDEIIGQYVPIIADRLRPFITPASVTCPTCHGKVELRHNKAGVWMQCLPGGCGRTWPIGKTDDLHPFITPACSPEPRHIAVLKKALIEFEASHMVMMLMPQNRGMKPASIIGEIRDVLATPASTGEANGWISVEENGLPRVGQWCWVVCNGFVQRMAAILVGKGFACADGYEWAWAIDEADPCPLETVTHWQPLPPAPTRRTPSGAAEMRRNKVLRIDPEVRVNAMKYVDEQLAVMREYGSISELSVEQYEDIVYRAAEPVQVIRNWNKRAAQAEPKGEPTK